MAFLDETGLAHLWEKIKALIPSIATTTEAKAGTNDTKMMTPLKVKQAIDEFRPDPGAYVTESWREGRSWYRKWSDGTIEQGGYSTGSNGRTISLHLKYSSSKSYVAVGIAAKTSSWNPMYGTGGLTEFTASSFKYNSLYDGSADLAWYTIGN